MPIATGECPNCGAKIEFRNGASMSLVCPYCRQMVVRSDRGLEKLGEAADVAATENSLAVGDTGTLVGKAFEVIGRLVLDHPAGGTWEEYYLALEGGGWGWLANEQGRWEASTPVDWERASGLQWPALEPGAKVSLGPYGEFVVAERNESRFATAQGELPFAAKPGTKRFFVDMSGENGGWATLDFGESEKSTPIIYVGRVIEPDDLDIGRTGAGPAKPTVPTTELKCPHCGGDLPARAPGKTEHIACPYCRTITDLATHEIIERQGEAREAIAIPLGSKGTLVGIEWTVIGYLERSGVLEGERFYWSEFLLYNPKDGFRWLVYDEGSFYFGTPVQAGEVDTSGLPNAVRFRNHRYSVRNSNPARVDFVLGEFYWKVRVGEAVQATDFECGTSVLSREVYENEIQWTFSTKMPSAWSVFQIFGVSAPPAPRSTSYGSSSSDDDEDVHLPTIGLSREAKTAIFWIIVAILLVWLMASLDDDGCGDDDGYSGGHHSHSYGGFGGK